MASKLDNHIDEIEEMIIEGSTFRVIAEKYNCSISTLHRFISKKEHSARISIALEVSADSYADKAEQTLIDAKRNKIEMTRARELAQHYRWKAGKRCPKRYSNNIDITSKGERIPGPDSIKVIFRDFSEETEE